MVVWHAEEERRVRCCCGHREGQAFKPLTPRAPLDDNGVMVPADGEDALDTVRGVVRSEEVYDAQRRRVRRLR